jgi:hypothetical protein
MGPQYTSCVSANDFEPIDYAYLAILGIIAGVGIAFAGIGLLLTSAAAVEALRYVLDWMLNRKLICLHRSNTHCNCNSSNDTTVCAIGEVADSEDIGEDKNPIDDVDNDYALNLILAPADHDDFAQNGEDAEANQKIARNGPQGDLITEQPGMPSFGGYSRTMVMLQKSGEYLPWTSIVGKNYKNFNNPDQNELWADFLVKNAWLDPKKYKVPVLHCEFEGSRISDLLDVINFFTFGGKWCKKNFLFKIICKIIQSVLSPIILAALMVAWAAAKDGDQKDALLDPNAGEVGPKDMVIMSGRWAFDGGHSGYNEMHAVRTLQRIDNVPGPGKAFEAFLNRWCEHMDETPPGPGPTGMSVPPMTPKQSDTQDRQRRPENIWQFHPLIDGCLPEDNDDNNGTVPVIK